MMPRIYFKRDKSRKAPDNIGDTFSDGLWYIPGVGIIGIKNGKCVMGITDAMDIEAENYEAEPNQERMGHWHYGFSDPIPITLTITKTR